MRPINNLQIAQIFYLHRFVFIKNIVAGRIDDEVQTILMQAYDKCTELLKAHDAQLDAVAAYLMAHNNMGRAQFEAVMEGKPVPDADVLPITSVEAIEEEPHPSEEE